MIYIVLAVLGLVFGSFINALVERIHLKKDWVRGRSRCDYCGHELAAKDLIPVVSWLALRGKCRYCQKPISAQNPLVELALVAAVITLYTYWPGGINDAADWLLFTTWLGCLVGLMALLVYDIRFMLLPNKLIYPTLLVALAGRLSYILFFATDKDHSLWQLALSVAIASGIFWLIYILSSGKWIGYGDVRLGWILGTLLADPALSFLMIFMASILGTIYVLPSLVMKVKKFGNKVAFGPFLILATFLTFLFGNKIIEQYKQLIGLS